MKVFQGTDADLIVKPEEDLMDLAEAFMSYRREDIKQAEEALTNNDFIFLRRLGHTIKGVARPYGFVYLETISKKLEEAAVAEDLERSRNLVQEMSYYINNVKVVTPPLNN